MRDLIKFCLHFQLYALQLHQKGTSKLLTIYSHSYLKPVIDLILCSLSILLVVLLFIGSNILLYSVKLKSLYYQIISDYFSINLWNFKLRLIKECISSKINMYFLYSLFLLQFLIIHLQN